MKRLLSLLLALCVLFALASAAAEATLPLTEADLYVDPSETITRNIRFGSFAFQGPDGWTSLEGIDDSGCLYVISPDGSNAFIVFADTIPNIDFANEATRIASYDLLMSNYNVSAYVDIGEVRYCQGNLANMDCYICIYGCGSDLIAIAYACTDGSLPNLSDMVPYTRTLIHD